jgi:molybdopterin synthase sulfur carrier subunit
MSAVRVPMPLRPFTEGQREIEVEGGTVGQALQSLAASYPGLKPHLFDDQGGLRAYVNVFVNDENVRRLQGEATPLKADDRVTIVPSVAGGRP